MPYLFLLDVDNTLLDNDHIKHSIWDSLVDVLGEEEAHHFWDHRQKIREREGIVSFPKAVREYCSENEDDTCDFRLHMIFSRIDFAGALYDCVPGVIKHLQKIGPVAIFTEGDTLYQQMKVEDSGLDNLVDKTYIYEHKLEHLDDIRSDFPGHTMVLVEDKPANITEFRNHEPTMKGIRVCQGHYSQDHPSHEEADLVLKSVEELANLASDHSLFKE